MSVTALGLSRRSYVPTFSAQTTKVTVKPSGAMTPSEKQKLVEAAAALEKAINSPAFLDELKTKLGTQKANQVYAKLLAGSEALSPAEDHDLGLDVAFANLRSVATTSPSSPLIQVSRGYFQNRDAPDLAHTLGYMLAYKLGYGAPVTDALGSVAEKLARIPSRPIPTTPTTPTTPTVPTPAGSPESYITAFHQGGTGNCVSIAAIKAAMARFGPDGIFASTTRSGAGYDVVMRDGYKVRVTDAELKTASDKSCISGSNAALVQKANLTFAAMAKRAQEEGNDGRRNMSFAQACGSLNDGESYIEGPKWLGIQKYVRTIDPDDMDKYPAVVAASKKHCVFGSGKYIDHYGTKRSNTNSYGTKVEGHGRPLRWAYALV